MGLTLDISDDGALFLKTEDTKILKSILKIVFI